LTQPSLYNAFGDKRGLFRAALAHYLITLNQRIARPEGSCPPALAVTTFLREIVERSVSDPQKRGCMLVNSLVEVTPEDEELRAEITAELQKIRGFFERCVAAAQARGDAPPVHGKRTGCGRVYGGADGDIEFNHIAGCDFDGERASVRRPHRGK
jgi:TetR/AcrR family transcriptional repressor of nem operon